MDAQNLKNFNGLQLVGGAPYEDASRSVGAGATTKVSSTANGPARRDKFNSCVGIVRQDSSSHLNIPKAPDVSYKPTNEGRDTTHSCTPGILSQS